MRTTAEQIEEERESEAAKWAFCSVSGYTVHGYRDADVDGWRKFTRDRLIEEVEAQVEYFGEGRKISGATAEKVADALIKYRDAENECEADYVYMSLWRK